MNSELHVGSEASEIIKTWPAFMEPRKVLRIFNGPPWGRYYFSLGRGRPQREVSAIWFCFRGRILGRIPIERIMQNYGSLPKLRSLSNEKSQWQLKNDVWVAICVPPMERLREKLYITGFRGWCYFDLKAYRRDPLSRLNL